LLGANFIGSGLVWHLAVPHAIFYRRQMAANRKKRSEDKA
jgi:hypothetical protein